MIQLKNPLAEYYFPSGEKNDAQLNRTTHLGIGAHQDDLEMLAIHGILAGYEQPDQAFTGVTVTDGRGAPRSGNYANLSDEDMWQIRQTEQRNAADIGRYNAQFQLNTTSNQVKSPHREDVITDLKTIIQTCDPKFIYTHNLADKHETHIAVALSVIEALRQMGSAAQGITVYGCEIWRDLDWMPDDKKVVLNVSSQTGLQMALLQAFTSQIAGGKRYDLAAMGRRRANATFFQSHQTDQAELIVYAMDLTPLIEHPNLEITDYLNGYIQDFSIDITDRLRKFKLE